MNALRCEIYLVPLVFVEVYPYMNAFCTFGNVLILFRVEFVLWLFSCLLKLLALPECEGLHQRIAECLDGILLVSNKHTHLWLEQCKQF